MSCGTSSPGTREEIILLHLKDALTKSQGEIWKALNKEQETEQGRAQPRAQRS